MLSNRQAACSPTALLLVVDCSTAVVVYPAVCSLGVTLPFQPMSPTAISVAWVVAAVVPVDPGSEVPFAVAVTSSGDAEAPATSSTVMDIVVIDADVPPTVTVTACDGDRLAASGAYQISPSPCPP